jgi:S-adenosylmethionine decarboxylase
MLKENEIKVGHHLIININTKMNLSPANDDELISIFEGLLDIMQVIVLNKSIHRFSPEGLTGLYLLSESHLSFHTWPEYGKICLDIFTCGKNKNEDILNFLNDKFEEITSRYLAR